MQTHIVHPGGKVHTVEEILDADRGHCVVHDFESHELTVEPREPPVLRQNSLLHIPAHRCMHTLRVAQQVLLGLGLLRLRLPMPKGNNAK